MLRTTSLAIGFALVAGVGASAQTAARPRPGVVAGPSSAAGKVVDRSRPRARVAGMAPAPQQQARHVPIPTTGYITNLDGRMVVPTTGLFTNYTAATAGPVTNSTGLWSNVTVIPGSQGVASTGYLYRPQPVQFFYLPAVLLSDGRILADFGTGRGYEQVLRRCPNLTGAIPPAYSVAPCWTVDRNGRVQVLSAR